MILATELRRSPERDGTSRAVRAALSYVVPGSATPRSYAFAPPPGEPWENSAFEQRVVNIADGRRPAGALSLEQQGFELWDAPSAIADFQDAEAVTSTYYAESAELALAATGASRAYVFDHLLRLREPGRPPLTFGRAANGRAAANGRIHNDYTEDSGRRRLELVLPDPRDTAVPPHAVRLFDETLAPVAHPRVAEALARGGSCPLLEFDDTRPWLQWRHWFADAHWQPERQQVLRFNHYDQVIQAAIAGQGVAIGRVELLQSLIDSRQLAITDIPCTPVKSPNAVWLLLAEEAPREEVAQVAEWIRLEAGQVRRWTPGDGERAAGG